MRTEKKTNKIVNAFLIPSSRYANEDFSFHHNLYPTDQRFIEQALNFYLVSKNTVTLL